MKVLLASDGQPPARRAQKVLEKLSRRTGLDVTVIAVASALEQAPPLQDWSRNRVVEAEQVAEQTAAELRTSGFDVTTLTRAGSPAEEILKAIDDYDIDLTVIGSGHRTWLGSLILGSVSTHVLHSSPSSVLIVHEWLQEPVTGRALVGVDGSKEALRAAELFSRFADPDRCVVTTMAVASNAHPVLIPHPALTPAYEPYDSNLQEDLIERASREAEQASRVLDDAGFETTTLTNLGSAANVLLKEVNSRRMDLVVVGSRGIGPVRRTILGSVSDNVARHAAGTLVARQSNVSPVAYASNLDKGHHQAGPSGTTNHTV
jgi:nucleotide-binding universal stress UspA family protein